MKYIEYKQLCQGKPENNHRGRGCVIALFISLCIWLGILSLIGCRSGYNSPRSTGWVISTPANLIGEIPGEELPRPYIIQSDKKPKASKHYILKEYKRETNYTK